MRMVVAVRVGWFVSGDGQQVHLCLLWELWSMTEETFSPLDTLNDSVLLRGAQLAQKSSNRTQSAPLRVHALRGGNKEIQHETRMKDQNQNPFINTHGKFCKIEDNAAHYHQRRSTLF